MFSIASNSGQTAYGVTRFLVDTVADIESLPTYHTPGSTALVIENSSRYVLNNNHEWKLLKSGSSGGGGGGSTDPGTLIKYADFSCYFENMTDHTAIQSGSITGDVSTSGNVVDLTSDITYLAPFEDIETLNIEISANSISPYGDAALPQVLLYFNNTTTPAHTAQFNDSKTANLSVSIPAGTGNVYLGLKNFAANGTKYYYSIKMQVELKEEEITDVIYDGGLI